MKHLIFILSILLFGINSLSQIKPAIHYTENDGLAGNSVRDIIKDKDGYLWFATDEGISRFDGNTFTNIYKNDGLVSNRVWALTSDNQNTIWAGCYRGGLNKIVDGKVVAKYDIELGKYSNSIRILHYSSYHDLLFIGTDYGIHIFKNGILTKLKLDGEDGNKNSVLAIKEINGKIYFTINGYSSINGVYTLDINKENLLLTKVDYINSQSLYALAKVKDKIYSNGNSLMREISLNNHCQTDSFPNTENFLPWDMAFDGKNTVWIAGWGGAIANGNLKQFDINRKQIINSQFDINANAFSCVFYDKKSGIVWAGGDNGIYALFDSQISIEKFQDKQTFIDVINFENRKYSLTDDGLFNINNGELEQVLSYDMIFQRVITNRRAFNQKHNINKGFEHLFRYSKMNLSELKVTKGELLIITNFGTIALYDKNLYLPFSNGKTYISDKKTYHIRNYGWLIIFNTSDNTFSWKHDNGSKGHIRDIIKIVEADNQTVIFPSHYHGLFALKNDSVLYLNSNNSTIDNSLSDIDISPDGQIWCTSTDGNLFRIGISNDSLHVITKLNQSHGIIGQKFKWLKFDKNKLFLATNEGLNIISSKQLENDILADIQFYNQHNGYKHIAAKKPQIDNNGNLFVFDSNTIITINTHINDTFRQSPIVIDDIHLNSQPFESIEDNQFKYNQNNIGFKFKVLKYPSSKNIEYEHRVNKQVWQKGNNIQLISLVHGDYAIDLQAFDKENGQTYSKTVYFTINKPMWLSWWFIVLSISILSMGIITIAQLRINHVRKRVGEKQALTTRLNEIRIRSLQGQLNPHFIFNALNSIQYFILSSKLKDALDYLGSLSGVIRKNLHNLGEEMIPLDDEVKFIQEYLRLEQMRFKEKLDFEIDINTHTKGILVPPMLFQPIIENAIKHGIMHSPKNGMIYIHIKEDSTLNILISDNGIGRDKAKQIAIENGTSNGIAIEITKERLKLLNQKFKTNAYTFNIEDLKDENGQPEGTRVCISLLAYTNNQR
ncbi:MAG: histidine kinase [Carboxylicivirga sp.]|jgi:ligand-binding sensor domain-containing protein|nr:histidine kinase [Carboxylicivirga sp.]